MRNSKTLLARFLRFGRSRGWCVANPAEGLVVPSVRSEAEPEVFTAEEFYDAQQETAAATEVRDETGKVVKAALLWKQNGLRHGFGSARLAITRDAVRVAHEMGNSAAVVHTHYKALMGSSAGRAWFDILPNRSGNVTVLGTAAPA